MESKGKKAIVNLPTRQVQAHDASHLRVLVEQAAPASSKFEHTAAFGEPGAEFAIPRIFDPARQKRIGLRGYGYNNYMDIDHNEEARKNLLDGVEVIMKTNPVMRACHPAGTLVDVEGSLVPIEDVAVGDEVKTHAGRYRKVLETMAFGYDGDMYSFKVHQSDSELRCTEDHNLYVFRRTGGTTYLDGALPEGEYKWVSASEVRIGDYLVMPVGKSVEDVERIVAKRDVEWVQGSYKTKTGKVVPPTKSKRSMRLEIKANADFFRFVGYHLSDGAASGNRTSICFGAHEVEYVDDVKRICRECLGIEAKARREGRRNMWVVDVNSAPLAQWLRDEFLCGAHSKRIPLWVQELPIEKQRQLLVGFFRGDGCNGKNEIVMNSVSRDLVNGLAAISIRCGYEVCVKWPRNCMFERFVADNEKASIVQTSLGAVRYSGASACSFRDDNGIRHEREKRPYSRVSLGFLSGDYMHFAVKSVSVERFEGAVYNLEVDEDHSYLADGFASHNCLEVYARYPTAGAHLECKNKDVKDFFEQIFFEDLDYENFLIDVGREYWQYGEVFANGVWDDSLGIWTGEELLDPRQMEIIRVPFSSENILKFVPDEDMKRIVNSMDVAGRIFEEENPEFAELVKTGKDILISPDRCVHLANKDSVRDLHGTPVALRAWNTLRLEERLQSAMLATADRMYAPLLLFSLGGNLADGSPYIPSPNAIATFRTRLDEALSSDFRALVTNQFVNVQEVIRGDKMANFKNDIDMYDDRLFMAWGLSSSILKPASGPYATSAMEFELASQMLRSYQKCLCELYNRRAAFVAEANGIYDYDIIGGVKIDKTEWREVWDESVNDGEGGYVIKEVPKLLYPELRMETINFNTTEKTRDFLMQLQKQGVPIARQAFFMGTDIDYRATAEQASQDAIHDAVQRAEEHAAIFRACVEKGVPVPPDTVKFMKDGIAPLEEQELLKKIAPKEDDGKDGPFGKSPEEEAVSQLEAVTDVVDEEEYAPGDGARPDVSDERREDMDAPGTFAAKGGDIPHEAARSAMKDVGSTKRSVVANHRASVRSKRTASLVEQGVPLVAEDGGDE